MKRVTVKATFTAIGGALEGTKQGFHQELDTSGSANLAFTGAKAYYRGGGWWVISGYAMDGLDVDRVLVVL